MLIEQSDNMIVTENETLDEQQQQQNDNLINSNSLSDSIHPQPQRNRSTVTYVNAQYGLFPAPLGRAAKMSQITRMKTKFKFIGKLMAKAVMDSRMLDLPCSIPFYRWILNEEHSLGLSDLARVAPEVQATLTRLHVLVSYAYRGWQRRNCKSLTYVPTDDTEGPTGETEATSDVPTTEETANPTGDPVTDDTEDPTGETEATSDVPTNDPTGETEATSDVPTDDPTGEKIICEFPKFIR